MLYPRGYHIDRSIVAKRKGLPNGALGKGPLHHIHRSKPCVGAFGVVYKATKSGQE